MHPYLRKVWFLMIFLPLLVGCSNTEQNLWEKKAGLAEEKPTGWIGSLKTTFNELQTKLGFGESLLNSAGEIFDKQPGALNILQGNATAEDWKNMDKSFLKAKAKELKQMAESAGISLDHTPTETERALLLNASKQFGVSQKRSAELESILKRKRERLLGTNEKIP